MRRYTDEERAFLREFIPGHSYSEIMYAFTERLGTAINLKQLKAFIKNNHVSTGLTGRFERGHVPANKGTKGMSHRNRTTFSKGNSPINRVPIGTEKLREDGYVYVKIQDGCKNANWKQKHIVIWEEANRPLGPTEVLIFGNGDSTDIRLDNLLLAERADLAVMNRQGLRGRDAESSQAAVLTAKLIRKVTSRTKVKA